MKYLISCLIAMSTFNASAHDHDLSHTWLGDKAAYESFEKMDLKQFKTSAKSRTVVIEKFDVDTQFIKEKLAQYSGAKTVSINGAMVTIKERKSSQGRALGMQFLKQEYENIGFIVSTHTYGSGRRKGVNFIAEKIGDDPSKVLILSSHIDTVGNAGANDDGSGTISALAIAKSLTKYRLKHTLRIVGFDQEEVGLVGSGHYVKTLDKKQIIGDIQLEMMGVNNRKDGAFHVIDCDKSHSTFLTAEIAQALVDQNIQASITKACTKRSDHAKFWKAGMPAVVISENFFGGDADKCYHKKCDVLDERIDFGYITNITQAVGYAVKKLLQAY